MSGFNLIEKKEWAIGSFFGYNHPFFYLNSDTIIHTWLVLILIGLFIVCAHFICKTRLGRHAVVSFVEFFIDLTTQSIGTFSFIHFSFVTSIFCFILVCNTAAVIPWVEEPTKDLNTTLALGIITFIYRHVVIIYQNGIGSYIKDYFKPFFLMFPLNVVGNLASVISISFRLFGNIFGGSIISKIYFSALEGSIVLETLGLLSGTNITITLFFTIFEGFLQAFVFTMLTLTYLAIALQDEGGH